MWTFAVAAFIAAGSDTTPPGSADLNVIIGTLGGAAIAAVGGIAVAALNRGNSRTPTTTAVASESQDVTGLHEDIAVLRYRADDKDDQLEIIDRRQSVAELRQERTEGRVEAIETFLDSDRPGWRHHD